MSDTPKKTGREESERPQLPKTAEGDDILASKSRAEAKSALEKGAVMVPPVEPGKPEDPAIRLDLTDSLHLESQYADRMDTILEMINREVFAEGVPIPTYDQVLKAFATDQLKIAKDYQWPILLIVPETSFKSKVAALDAALAVLKERSALSVNHSGRVSKADRGRAAEIGGWQNAHVDWDTFLNTDPGSERITGWRAAIVDGAVDVDPGAMGDDVKLTLTERIKNRRDARKPCEKGREKGMDRHLCAMLMLEGLMRGEPIGKVSHDWRFTLLEDDSANSDSRVPYADWDSDFQRVGFFWVHPEARLDYGRFRRSVGVMLSRLMNKGAKAK